MNPRAKTALISTLLLLAGCGPGRGNGGIPPGQMQHATGYNPASGHVRAPGPSVEVKLK